MSQIRRGSVGGGVRLVDLDYFLGSLGARVLRFFPKQDELSEM